MFGIFPSNWNMSTLATTINIRANTAPVWGVIQNAPTPMATPKEIENQSTVISEPIA